MTRQKAALNDAAYRPDNVDLRRFRAGPPAPLVLAVFRRYDRSRFHGGGTTVSQHLLDVGPQSKLNWLGAVYQFSPRHRGSY